MEDQIMRLINSVFCTVTAQIIASLCLVTLVGCASRIDKITPTDMQSMDEVYDGQMGKKNAEKARRRAAEINARPLSDNEGVSDLPPAMLHARQLYPKLPNPEVFMYVKPHPTGQSGAVVPGYYTRFHMFERDYYALPEESLGSTAPLVQRLEEEHAKKAKAHEHAKSTGKKH
jgi:conjugative transfer region lipoprotein (TIGR03751 family)